MADLFDHSVADITSVLLKDLSLGVLRGTAGNWPISTNSEENKPDDVITIYDTEPIYHGRAQYTGDKLSHPGIQIRVRGRDQRTAYRKAKAIAVKIDREVNHETVEVDSNTYCVQSISRQTSIKYLGKEDGSQRHIFTMDALVTIRQLS